jgi:hypothetical protein
MGSTRWRAAAAVVVALLAALGAFSPAVSAIGAGSVPAVLEDPCVSRPLDVSYDVEYVAELGGYGVTRVRVDGLDPRCDGRELSIALTGVDGVALVDVPTYAVGSGSARETVVLPEAVPAADVARVSAVLHTASARTGG